MSPVGATEALAVFETKAYKDKTEVGNPEDATSLENMKNSLKWIQKCNDLRKANGLAELKVGDYGMAAAQYDANASAYTMSHIRKFYLGENLSWGYADPFVGWYDREKEIYESGYNVESGTGHYRNIINKNYLTTGFAICQHGAYSVTYSQVFDLYHETNEMSLEEYTARFMNYYNSLMNAPTITQQALQNLNNAKVALMWRIRT